ncbi:14 kDa proline-rich protein DC2.15-like [Impatiens glandulifera]|uniref:14 kDa proline-rich protein DC2.15-like n=1 Tax=Impatiens glandulifera TaxID=253017 RepID=UPI001FB16393|nr:14 kDa proline-rich protein DC2.15-like [Impatiens glandulifera]
MVPKISNCLAFFITLDLLFFSLVSSSLAPHTCPMEDTLKLGVCDDFLGRLIGVIIEYPPNTSCCALINGLVDLEAAICLCTAIKENVLGINHNVPASLNLLLYACGKKTPPDFNCV